MFLPLCIISKLIRIRQSESKLDPSDRKTQLTTHPDEKEEYEEVGKVTWIAQLANGDALELLADDLCFLRTRVVVDAGKCVEDAMMLCSNFAVVDV